MPRRRRRRLNPPARRPRRYCLASLAVASTVACCATAATVAAIAAIVTAADAIACHTAAVAVIAVAVAAVAVAATAAIAVVAAVAANRRASRIAVVPPSRALGCAYFLYSLVYLITIQKICSPPGRDFSVPAPWAPSGATASQCSVTVSRGATSVLSRFFVVRLLYTYNILAFSYLLICL